MEKQNKMDKIVTAMAEHICDHLCRFPREISDQEELDNICVGCGMAQYICNILNEHSRAKQSGRDKP